MRFEYENNPDNELDIGVINPSILLEPGYRGGTIPRIIEKPVNSYLGEFITESGFQDIAKDTCPFNVKVLCLERIFAEKLCAIKSLYERNGLKTRTRHYYDVCKLIDAPEIKALLNNISEFNVILQDISTISHQYFGIKEDSSIISIKACPALQPEHHCINELSAAYTGDKALYYQEHPDFGEMLVKIAVFLQDLSEESEKV